MNWNEKGPNPSFNDKNMINIGLFSSTGTKEHGFSTRRRQYLNHWRTSSPSCWFIVQNLRKFSSQDWQKISKDNIIGLELSSESKLRRKMKKRTLKFRKTKLNFSFRRQCRRARCGWSWSAWPPLSTSSLAETLKSSTPRSAMRP